MSLSCGPAVQCSLGRSLSFCKQTLLFPSDLTLQSSYWTTRKLGLLTRRGRPSWVVCCGKLPKMGSPIFYFLSTQQVTQGTRKTCTLPIQYVPCVFPRYVTQKVSPPGFVEYLSPSPCLSFFHILPGPFNAGYHAGSPFSDLGLFNL